MELIPVLDLMGGAVVHARRGDRAAYRPIETPLCAGSDPLDIASALLDLAPFRTLYIADLDAIRGGGGHGSVIATLRGRFPALQVWVDAGEADAEAIEARRVAGLSRPVVGTEVLAGIEQARGALSSGAAILSLDHNADGPLGPRELHDQPALWPDRVIVMTLARVGAGEGPDFECLRAVKAKAGNRRVYAAGGVRTAHDLEILAEIGTAGALVASALHDGRLTRATLARFMP